MFSLLPSWSIGATNKKASTVPVNTSTPELDHRSTLMAPPGPSGKTKRKRRESEGSAVSLATLNPPKKKAEYMSHVEIPRSLSDFSMTTPAQPNGPVPAHKQTQAEGNGEMHVDEGGGNALQDISGAAHNTVEQVQNISTMEEGQDTSSKPHGESQATMDVATMTPLREMIEAQFSLEILLKHNELRLIDQEIAKCQIGLEQLRRCSAIPYPAMTGNTADMMAVAGYDGAAGDVPPPTPAPWGVTDGPYTRHYARWLIPDPAFDGHVAADVQRVRSTGKTTPKRITRGAKSVNSAPPPAKRSQRGSAGNRLQALPAGYPEPKEEKGPMIVKRSSDGKMVKLVCFECRRENFNSVQGFINHCRIAHGRAFTSHDAAALACGEEIEYDEAGGVISESTGTGAVSVGLVHPLNRSVHVAALAPTYTTSKRRKSSHCKSSSAQQVPVQSQNQPARSKSGSVPASNDPFATQPFIPSKETPHLSALFAKIGRGGDLNGLVNETTSKIDVEDGMDIPSDGDDDGDFKMEDVPEERQSSLMRGGRLPARATMSPAPLDRAFEGPSSGRGTEKPSRKAVPYLDTVSRRDYASPYLTATPTSNLQAHSGTGRTVLLSSEPPINLSPNTLEANPAPSLVSDDDDDYEDAHSESEAPSSEGGDEDEDLDIEVENEEEVGGPSVDPELTTSAKARRIPQPTRRRSVLRSPGVAVEGRGPGARRVSFRSPTRERGHGAAHGGRKGR
jgi:ADA HAT complex component 1